MLSDNPYFPYPKFKSAQKEIMITLIKKEKNPVMIEAQTGSGKTIAVLSSLLVARKSNQKIFIFVKTINQINSFLREWGVIYRKLHENNLQYNQVDKLQNPIIIPLLGQNRICVNGSVVTKKTIYGCEKKKPISSRKLSMIFKKLSRRNYRYRLAKWINWQLIRKENPTVDDFINIISTRENCPYYNVLSIIKDADIIITTYGYLQPKNLNRMLNYATIKISDSLICIDEAHNLALEKFHSLDKFYLEVFLKLFSSNDFLKSFFNLIRGVRILHLNEYFSHKEFTQGIKENLYKTNIAIQILKSENVNSLNLPVKLLEDDYLLKGVNQIKSFLENLKLIKLDRDYIITSNKSVLLPVLPIKRTISILNQSDRLVLQSATFSPMTGFQKILGLPGSTEHLDLLEKDVRKIRRIPNEFRAAYVSAVISSSRFRGKGLYERFSSLLLEIYKVSPSHILVLSPSYEFNEELAKSLTLSSKDGIDQSIPLILEEPKSSTFELHGKILNQKTKCIILGNQRGKILEGNEWVINGRSVVSTVVLAGLATAIPRDEDPILYKIRLEKLRDQKLTRLFQNQIPLHIIAKQALGRTIRSDKDKGALIILDARVDEFLQRNLWLYRYQIFSELLGDLHSFFMKTETTIDTESYGGNYL